jgi:penicillin-binding protein 1A
VTGVWVGFDQPKTIIANGYAADVAVPIWGSFMKGATKSDKPDWLDKPENVVTVSVCRLSGKLPANGCDSVQVVNKQGGLETRSMVYTEYFARGTEPTAFCNLHPIGGFNGAVATVFTPSEKPDPVRIEPPRPPVAVVTDTTHASSPPPAETEPPKKKRGFWSKIFGGRDRANDEKKARQQ